MAVFVLDRRKKPLMPCSEKRARIMLERGRASGGFNIQTATGLIKGIPHRFRAMIQRADGYGYSLTKIASNKGETGTGAAHAAALSPPRHKRRGFPRNWMKFIKIFHAMVFACLMAAQADATTISAPQVFNPYFSTPVYTNSWAYLNGTTTGGWTFAPTSYGGKSGISGNGSGGWYDPSTLPSGTTQAAFLQGGAISQTVSGFVVGQQYTVSLDMAQRPNYKVDPLTVAVGGVNLNTFTPSTTIFTNATTSQFTAESNSLNIAFNGYPISLCDPTFYTTYDLACDLDSAITNISVQVVGTGAQTQTQINEPDALFLLSASIILLLLVMNYRTYQHKQYKKTTNKKDLTEVVVNSNLSKRNGDQNEIYKNFSCNGFCLSHGGTS